MNEQYQRGERAGKKKLIFCDIWLAEITSKKMQVSQRERERKEHL